jgi:hypothetical protein
LECSTKHKNIVKINGQRSANSLPTATTTAGHMSILNGFKTCRKGLHQYPTELKCCPECGKESRRRWKKQNPERNQQWHKNNFERKRENSRRWNKENPEQAREKSRRWHRENPDKSRAQRNRRRARAKNATPLWADQTAINSIYAEAIRLEKETGVKYHVDHIYPLQNDYMCGLHVETNLQILTEKENIKKSNRTWPGQLECQRLPLHLNGFEKVPDWNRPS